MSEKTFNQMSEIEPIVLQLINYIDGNNWEDVKEFPYMYFRGDKEVIIKKALANIKTALES